MFNLFILLTLMSMGRINADHELKHFNPGRTFKVVREKRSDAKKDSFKACIDYGAKFNSLDFLTKIEVPTRRSQIKDYKKCQKKFQRVDVYQARYSCESDCQKSATENTYQCAARFLAVQEKQLPSLWRVVSSSCSKD
ncbi:MAG: hypothetical protein JWQ35_1037 [Bacteriovoracaceae bacterium]|nr:hypothetical protein [Bacteriovoracaceae bacterium]